MNSGRDFALFGLWLLAIIASFFGLAYAEGALLLLSVLDLIACIVIVVLVLRRQTRD
jgi:hypothetical protein